MYGSVESLKAMTGVSKKTFNLDTEEAVDSLLSNWLGQITAEIDARLGKPVPAGDPRLAGVTAVAERRTAMLVGYILQNRSNRVAEPGEYSTRILSATQVVEGLTEELIPYMDDSGDGKRIKYSVFLGTEEYVEPGGSV